VWYYSCSEWCPFYTGPTRHNSNSFLQPLHVHFRFRLSHTTVHVVHVPNVAPFILGQQDTTAAVSYSHFICTSVSVSVTQLYMFSTFRMMPLPYWGNKTQQQQFPTTTSCALPFPSQSLNCTCSPRKSTSTGQVSVWCESAVSRANIQFFSSKPCVFRTKQKTLGKLMLQ
jgi:hypothetical protein